MSIRTYQPADRQACLDIFKSNCPPYLDPTEIDRLENWLNGMDKGRITYKNSSANFFYVLTLDEQVIACGGFYIMQNKPNASMAWGMVAAPYHKQGYGRQLFQYRVAQIQQLYPAHAIVLDTSQHTFGFFQQLGFKVTKITKNGYGPGLHRYDMAR